MQYRNTELELKAGDTILFYDEFDIRKHMTLLSWAIRKFTKFPYNHCALVVEDNGNFFINEAVAGGIIGRPLEDHIDRDGVSIIVLRSKTAIDQLAFSKKADTKRGLAYNFKGLIVDNVIYRLPKLLFGVPGPWTGHTGIFATGKMVCSQYCAWAHDLPNWWEMSAREVYYSGAFDIIYQEKPLLV